MIIFNWALIIKILLFISKKYYIIYINVSYTLLTHVYHLLSIKLIKQNKKNLIIFTFVNNFFFKTIF